MNYEENDFFSIKELQNILGIGKNTAYKLTQIKGFPKIQIGNKIIIPKNQFNKWIENNIGNKINI